MCFYAAVACYLRSIFKLPRQLALCALNIAWANVG
jgi:hypothetical protein